MVTKTLVAAGSTEEVFSHHCPAPAGVYLMQGLSGRGYAGIKV